MYFKKRISTICLKTYFFRGMIRVKNKKGPESKKSPYMFFYQGCISAFFCCLSLKSHVVQITIRLMGWLNGCFPVLSSTAALNQYNVPGFRL